MMPEAILSETLGNYTISVVPDYNAGSPREWTNVSRIISGSQWSGIADEQRSFSPAELRELAAEMLADADALAVWALTIYDYGSNGIGLALSEMYEPGAEIDSETRFDALVYADAESCRESFGETWTLEQMRGAVTSEIEELSRWARGETYGYVVSDEAGEHIDSCWGFIGEPERALAEGRSAAEYQIDADSSDRWLVEIVTNGPHQKQEIEGHTRAVRYIAEALRKEATTKHVRVSLRALS